MKSFAGPAACAIPPCSPRRSLSRVVGSAQQEPWLRRHPRSLLAVSFFILHVSLAFAAQLPSLFRGVVLANSELGVRVVSVEEDSQAALADLRPEDVIVQVDDTALKTIDEFAVLSHALKRRSTKATVVVLRNGQSRQLFVHLYSYPVLRQWGLTFVPDYDLRFVDAAAGLAYWTRMARGFDIAGQSDQALNAWLNALHHQPQDVEVAVHVVELLCRIAQAKLKARQLGEALIAIQEGTILLGKLFDQPLDTAKLQAIKSQLEATLHALQSR